MPKIYKSRLLLICVALGGVFLFGFQQPVHAKGITVSPAYTEIEVSDPIKNQFIELSYTNDSQKPITLELYPIDFHQKSPSGEISFAGINQDEYSYSLASFLSFESDTLVVEPGQTAAYKVKILNRPDLSPGGHYAAIVAKLVQDPGEKRTAVAPAVSSLVYLRKVGGERFHLTLSDITWSASPVHIKIPENITLQLQNEGNVHVIPYGTVEITDLFGRVVYRGVINESSLIVLPQSRRNMLVNLRQIKTNFPLSFYRISVNGRDSLNKTTFFFRDSFIFINYWAIIMVCVVLVGIGWLMVRKRKRTHHNNHA